MRLIKDVIYDKDNNIALDLYLPDEDNYDVIVYCHGGGLVSGTKNDESNVLIGERLAKNGIGFATVDYRMYPNNKYPTFLIDFANAVKFVKDNIKGYGGNGNIYVSGQSGGAWLAVMLCFNHKWLNDVNIDPMSIKGWIFDSSQVTSHFNVINYELGLDTRCQRIDKFSPMFYIDKDFKFTRILDIFYENDMLTRPEQNRLMVATIKHFNPSADIVAVQLSGQHCSGSTVLESNGDLRFVNEILKWMKGN